MNDRDLKLLKKKKNFKSQPMNKKKGKKYKGKISKKLL